MVKTIISTIILALVALFALSSCSDEGTFDKFIAQHTAAMGGAAAVENIKNIDIHIKLTEGEREMKAHYRATRDGQMRIDVYVEDERVFTEALSSINDGWQMDGGEEAATPLSEQGKAALQNGVYSNLYGLHELEKLGYTLDFQGLLPFMGKEQWAVDVTSPNGQLVRQFFDPESYLMSGSMDESALHVDVDPTKQLTVTTYSDYQEIGGVMYSMQSHRVNVESGEFVQNVEIESLVVNSDFDPQQFIKP